MIPTITIINFDEIIYSRTCPNCGRHENDGGSFCWNMFCPGYN